MMPENFGADAFARLTPTLADSTYTHLKPC